jgi:hypothetical protein
MHGDIKVKPRERAFKQFKSPVLNVLKMLPVEMKHAPAQCQLWPVLERQQQHNSGPSHEIVALRFIFDSLFCSTF